MLRCGLWHKQGCLNRALSLRLGRARAYRPQSERSLSSSSPASAREGDKEASENSAQQPAGAGSADAPRSRPWQSSAPPGPRVGAGPPGNSQGWGGSWGSSSMAQPRSSGGPENPLRDGLLPHERAARDEAVRRRSAAAAATAGPAASPAPPAPEVQSEAANKALPGHDPLPFPRINATREKKKLNRAGQAPDSPSDALSSSGNRRPFQGRPPASGRDHPTSTNPPKPRRRGPAGRGVDTPPDSRAPEVGIGDDNANPAIDHDGDKATEWGQLRRRGARQSSEDGPVNIKWNSVDRSTLRKKNWNESTPAPEWWSAGPRDTRPRPQARPIGEDDGQEKLGNTAARDALDTPRRRDPADLAGSTRRVPPQTSRPGSALDVEGEGENTWRRGGGSQPDTAREAERRDRLERPKKPKPRRQRGEEDDEDYDEERAERRRRKAQLKAERERKKQLEAEQAGPTPILLPEFISVSNLAVALGVKQEVFLRQLQQLGFEDISQDHIMAGDTAALVAQEYGFEPTVGVGEGVDLKPRPPPDDPSTLPPRPPVVTIMGHVDHGKTTLLDWLRKSSIVAQEHGGITQHIGAFSVELSAGKRITFLDTPGHAAFLAMRQRGANVTDIVILVVAADDSVKPQTIEALKHARAARVPIIVAINKVDKEEARVDMVKADLAKNGVEIEDYGGDVQVVCVSGKTGQGMDDLEENIVTLSEILDMRAETDGMAEGWVLESSVKPIGRVATVLVKRGTLRKGDFIVAGKVWAKVRILRNEAGAEIDEAPPGTPVEILGWKEPPDAGDQVLQAPDEAKAKDAAHYRRELDDREDAVADIARLQQEKREREKAAAATAATADAGEEAEPDPPGTKVVNFVVKGDVHGSVEAVSAAVLEIGNNEVRPRILRSAAGHITESDVEHAATSGSMIINFNNPIAGMIKGMADDAGVKILDHNVIYHLADDIKSTLSEHLAPVITTRVLGEAEILQVFPINVRGRVYKNIAGCRVRNGLVTRNAKCRVLRRGEKVYEGTADALRQGKKDAAEVRKGAECGISFHNWDEFREGDQIQVYEEVSNKRHL